MCVYEGDKMFSSNYTSRRAHMFKEGDKVFGVNPNGSNVNWSDKSHDIIGYVGKNLRS